MEYIGRAIDSNWVAPLGENVDALEREMSELAGVPHAAALASGTAAVHLAVLACGAGPGDRVFCSDFTFIGSCSPVLYTGAEPVFIDSEGESWNMSPEALERALSDAKRENRLPKAVIVVDLYGTPADYGKLLPLCEAYGVPVIEDAAEALAAAYRGSPCGSFGLAGVFSFNGNKLVTTSGGGMAVSRDGELIDRMRYLASQARQPARHYEHTEAGYNYRLSNLCAGVGLGQLHGLQSRLLRKRELYETYRRELSGLPVSFAPAPPDCEPSRWLSCMTLAPGCGVSPDRLIAALEERNIESRPLWKPMHLQPVFGSCERYLAEDAGPEGHCGELFSRGICLPSGTAMTGGELDRVIETVREVFR